jgi:hypothetical protein
MVMLSAAASLHFDECDNTAATRDQIDLTRTSAEISVEDAPTRAGKRGNGEIFTTSAEYVVASHAQNIASASGAPTWRCGTILNGFQRRERRRNPEGKTRRTDSEISSTRGHGYAASVHSFKTIRPLRLSVQNLLCSPR